MMGGIATRSPAITTSPEPELEPEPPAAASSAVTSTIFPRTVSRASALATTVPRTTTTSCSTCSEDALQHCITPRRVILTKCACSVSATAVSESYLVTLIDVRRRRDGGRQARRAGGSRGSSSCARRPRRASSARSGASSSSTRRSARARRSCTLCAARSSASSTSSRKTHRAAELDARACVVSTVRMPLDSICSSILRAAPARRAAAAAATGPPDDAVLRDHVKQFRENGGDGLLALVRGDGGAAARPPVLLLRYEEFVHEVDRVLRRVRIVLWRADRARAPREPHRGLRRAPRLQPDREPRLRRARQARRGAGRGRGGRPRAPPPPARARSGTGGTCRTTSASLATGARCSRPRSSGRSRPSSRASSPSSGTPRSCRRPDAATPPRRRLGRGRRRRRRAVPELLARYSDAHARAALPRARGDAACARRYVVAPLCSDGVGNCLNGALNALAVAVVLNRTVLIDADEKGAMHRYYGEFAFRPYRAARDAWERHFAAPPARPARASASARRRARRRSGRSTCGRRTIRSPPSKRAAGAGIRRAAVRGPRRGGAPVPARRPGVELGRAAARDEPQPRRGRARPRRRALRRARRVGRGGGGAAAPPANVWGALHAALFGAGAAPLSANLSRVVEAALPPARYDLALHVRHQRVHGGPANADIDAHALACARAALGAARLAAGAPPLRAFVASDNLANRDALIEGVRAMLPAGSAVAHFDAARVDAAAARALDDAAPQKARWGDWGTFGANRWASLVDLHLAARARGRRHQGLDLLRARGRAPRRRRGAAPRGRRRERRAQGRVPLRPAAPRRAEVHARRRALAVAAVPLGPARARRGGRVLRAAARPARRRRPRRRRPTRSRRPIPGARAPRRRPPPTTRGAPRRPRPTPRGGGRDDRCGSSPTRPRTRPASRARAATTRRPPRSK